MRTSPTPSENKTFRSSGGYFPVGIRADALKAPQPNKSMLRNVLLAGLLASASAFSAAPMTPALRSATVPSSRPQCTQLKMIDETTALVAAPGLIAAGALLRDSFFPVTSVAAPAAAPAPAATSVSSTEMLNLARVRT